MNTLEERAQDYGFIAKERGDMPYELGEAVYIEIAREQKAIDDAKYQRLRSLAKMMYDAAMCLTTDASKLREACNEFKHYINYEEKE